MLTCGTTLYAEQFFLLYFFGHARAGALLHQPWMDARMQEAEPGHTTNTTNAAPLEGQRVHEATEFVNVKFCLSPHGAPRRVCSVYDDVTCV